MNQPRPHPPAAAFLHAAQDEERREAQVHGLRDAPSAEDDDGQPLTDDAVSAKSSHRAGGAAPGKQRSPRCSDPPRASKERPFAPRPTHQEVEHRIAEAQLWIAQRLPLAAIRANARQNWGIRATTRRSLKRRLKSMVGDIRGDDFRKEADQRWTGERGVPGVPYGWIVPVLGGEQWRGHHSATSGSSSKPG